MKRIAALVLFFVCQSAVYAGEVVHSRTARFSMEFPAAWVVTRIGEDCFSAAGPNMYSVMIVQAEPATEAQVSQEGRALLDAGKSQPKLAGYAQAAKLGGVSGFTAVNVGPTAALYPDLATAGREYVHMKVTFCYRNGRRYAVTAASFASSAKKAVRLSKECFVDTFLAVQSFKFL